MLQYAGGGVVTRNAAEKKINSVLDFVSAQEKDSQLLQARGQGWVVGLCRGHRSKAGCACVAEAFP